MGEPLKHLHRLFSRIASALPDPRVDSPLDPLTRNRYLIGMLTTSEDDFAEMPQDPLVETEKAPMAPGEESFEPELMRLQVAKKLFKKAIATYELLLMSQDPKIRKEVAKDILEVVGAKAPKGQQQGGNIQIALFPPEYVAKVAQGLSKFQEAEVIDVEGVQVYETSLPKPLLGDSPGSGSGSGLSGSDS